VGIENISFGNSASGQSFASNHLTLSAKQPGATETMTATAVTTVTAVTMATEPKEAPARRSAAPTGRSGSRSWGGFY
jgi:hypothetical protein